MGGGTGIVNYNLFEQWARNEEISIDLVTSSRSRSTYEKEQFAERISIHKVPVNNRNIHHASNRELIAYTLRATRYGFKLAAAHRYDLSFAFSGVPAGFLSYLFYRRYKLPYVVSLEGADIPGFEPRYNYLYPLLKPILRRVWRNAAVLTAISPWQLALAHEFMPEIDIPIVPNGVDAAQFCPAARGGQRDRIHMVCVGRLIERKGQHHLLRAFASLLQQTDTELHLELVGTGDSESMLKSLATELGVSEQVTFAGTVAREKIPELYRRADFFVLPSLAESMSMALLEAMASGLPVAVTPTGAAEELVDDNGVIIPWGDPEGIARSLRPLLQDTECLLRMGQRSREIALRYTWDKVADRYVQMFRDIIAGREATRPEPVSADAADS